jgi:hypothetical protein
VNVWVVFTRKTRRSARSELICGFTRFPNERVAKHIRKSSAALPPPTPAPPAAAAGLAATGQLASKGHPDKRHHRVPGASGGRGASGDITSSDTGLENGPRKSRRTPAFSYAPPHPLHYTGGWVSPGVCDAACPCSRLGVGLVVTCVGLSWGSLRHPQ